MVHQRCTRRHAQWLAVTAGNPAAAASGRSLTIATMEPGTCYFREAGVPVRRRVGRPEDEAGLLAAQINSQLASAGLTMFSFTPLPGAELRRRFLEHHELVLRSSLATVRRYRAATQHLEDFVAKRCRSIRATRATYRQSSCVRGRRPAPATIAKKSEALAGTGVRPLCLFRGLGGLLCAAGCRVPDQDYDLNGSTTERSARLRMPSPPISPIAASTSSCSGSCSTFTTTPT